MSHSKVDICNMAIGKCGIQKTIHALEFGEGQAVPVEAHQCRLYWDLAFGATARSHNWKCLMAQKDISGQRAAAPRFGYSYAYSLPADYIGWLTVEDSSIPYKKQGRQVYSDAASLNIEYVRRTDDTDLLDELFVEALVMRLAAHIAPGLMGTEGHKIAQDLRLWHERVSLPQGAHADSAEQSMEEMTGSSWLEARQ